MKKSELSWNEVLIEIPNDNSPSATKYPLLREESTFMVSTITRVPVHIIHILICVWFSKERAGIAIFLLSSLTHISMENTMENPNSGSLEAWGNTSV